MHITIKMPKIINFKIGQLFNFFKYYPEGDGYTIMHTHFDCPVCGAKDIGTDYLTEYYGNDKFYENEKFFCGKCRSEFITRSMAKIELLGLGDDRQWLYIDSKNLKQRHVPSPNYNRYREILFRIYGRIN